MSVWRRRIAGRPLLGRTATGRPVTPGPGKGGGGKGGGGNTGGGGSIKKPANTVAPAITGTVREGKTLTASTGTWDNSPTSYAYQWKDDGALISGATSSTYVLTTANVGGVITVTVTAANGAGTANATSAGTIAVVALPEPYFNEVVFLSSFDGADAATTATDDSDYAHTIVFGVNGTGNAELDTAQKVFGTASAYVNANDGSTASIAVNDHEVFNPTGDYTWEHRVRFQTLNGTVRSLFTKWNTAAGENSYFCHYRVADQTLRFAYSTDGTNAHATVCEVPWSAVINTWYAIRICKVGSDILFYVNGTYLGKDTLGGTIFDSGTSFRIGAAGNSTSTELQGWIDEMRLTKGVARSGEADYTVDTAAFPRL